MTRFSPLVGLLLVCLSTPVSSQEQGEPGSHVILNGVTVAVRWTDGDSFRILDGEHAGRDVRLAGFNALESYGPVHRWGEWSPAQLYAIARQAMEAARRGTWTCTTQGAPDRYNRLLVSCEDLVLALVSQGLVHLLCVEGTVPPEQVETQREAQSQGLGMWARGVPESIVTSLHSASEGGEPYNRLVSTADGTSEEVSHSDTYETCQEVCMGASCLVYVPFELRYGSGRAECLRPPSIEEGTGHAP